MSLLFSLLPKSLTCIILFLVYRFTKFFNSGVLSKSSFVSKIFYDSSCLAYTFIGYMYGHNHFKNENSSADVAKLIRSIRYTFGYVSPFEDLIIRLINNLLTPHSSLISHLFFLLFFSFVPFCFGM